MRAAVVAAPCQVRTARVPVPQPGPGEALGCAINVFRRSDIKSGQTVAIVGVGFLGAVLTALSAQVGARVLALGEVDETWGGCAALDWACRLARGERFAPEAEQFCRVAETLDSIYAHAGDFGREHQP